MAYVASMMRVNHPISRTSLTPEEISRRMVESVSALYVHVPFCLSKCAYCDFYSLANQSEEVMRSYVDAVLREAQWWAPKAHTALNTVFFGGGTPTCLPLPFMRRLIRGLRQLFVFTDDIEWTLEANPATINEDYCRMLLDEGVNRLSIGAQSLIDSELASLGRIHTVASIEQTVATAAKSGFSNLSLDLMYATPGQTQASWEHTLEGAINLQTKHISAYCLTLEENTPMWMEVHAGRVQQPAEQQQIDLMRFTRQFLPSKGYQPYEISNFAHEGYECRHNLAYWRGDNYIGLGPAAASHMAERRWRNTPDNTTYIHSVLSHDINSVVDDELLTPEQRATELIMLMLRTRSGLDESRLKQITGLEINAILSLARMSQLGLLCRDKSSIILTEKGVVVADEVISELIRELG